jgi:glycerophosphoryl diester phosphodiesterase
MMIFAHRGNSSVAPENTLAAFRAAQQARAHGVELDVQLSRDGVPMVIHDERLERTTTGKGWVREHTLAQLQALDAGVWFGAGFAGERIPTLAQVLELFQGTDTWVNIELKTNRLPYPGLVASTLKEVERFGMARQVIISSFNHNSLKEVQAQSGKSACAAILYDTLVEPWAYALQHGFQALHPHYLQVDEALMAGCRGAGLVLRPWTVDEVPAALQLNALGVSGLITNKPQDMLAALRS